MDIAESTLLQLLDANARFALDARGTTNHCPMVLVALARMGATPDRLRAFFAQWVEKYAISETPRGVAIAGDDWLAHVGDAAAFGSLQAYFHDRIARNGVTAMIADVMSRAPCAPATGAFHAIIRLAYGIEAGHCGEIAAGLAAYVATSLPIEVDWNGRRPAESVGEGLVGIPEHLLRKGWPSGSITGRLRAIAVDPEFQSAMQAPPAGALLNDMARVSIQLYWQKADFTVLHMVTGAHAARIVLAQLPAQIGDQLLVAMWTALCAAYVSAGVVRSIPIDAPKIAPDWPAVFERAVASNDDHVIKMAYTCFKESERDPECLYYQAAVRCVA
ncbi:MAG: questin oxidase family protein [Pseudomonadota bacterium]|nr:questin oxidase family protein [Pseudomonadota bacterium]